MKKLIPLLVAVSFVVVALPGMTLARDLKWEDGTVVGNVNVGVATTTSSITLTIDYTLSAPTGWHLAETHLYVDYSESLGGAPPPRHSPGQFRKRGIGDIHDDLWDYNTCTGPDSDSYTITVTGLTSGTTYYFSIAAHAELQRIQSGTCGVDVVYEDKTAWAQGDDEIRTGKDWSTYWNIPVTTQ